MATKKAPKPAKRQLVIKVGCCSAALDLVFQDGDGFTVEPGDGKAVPVPMIRLRHATKKFMMRGLLDGDVDKHYHPWRVYVLPAEEPTSLTIPQATSTRKQKKK